ALHAHCNAGCRGELRALLVADVDHGVAAQAGRLGLEGPQHCLQRRIPILPIGADDSHLFEIVLHEGAIHDDAHGPWIGRKCFAGQDVIGPRRRGEIGAPERDREEQQCEGRFHGPSIREARPTADNVTTSTSRTPKQVCETYCVTGTLSVVVEVEPSGFSCVTIRVSVLVTKQPHSYVYCSSITSSLVAKVSIRP